MMRVPGPTYLIERHCVSVRQLTPFLCSEYLRAVKTVSGREKLFTRLEHPELIRFFFCVCIFIPKGNGRDDVHSELSEHYANRIKSRSYLELLLLWTDRSSAFFLSKAGEKQNEIRSEKFPTNICCPTSFFHSSVCFSFAAVKHPEFQWLWEFEFTFPWLLRFQFQVENPDENLIHCR